MRRGILLGIIVTAVCAIVGSCGSGSDRRLAGKADSTGHRLPDTLRVATLYSPEAYFIYRGQEMGYDYELVTSFAADKDLPLKMEIAPSLSRAIEMLDSGIVDLIAYEVPVTAEYKDRVIPCGPENVTTQVLVQPKKGETELITDVTDLVGKDVYVESESKYEARIRNLNQEVGGGINIHTVDRDTMITEDLIAMVSEGKSLSPLSTAISRESIRHITTISTSRFLSVSNSAQAGRSRRRKRGSATASMPGSTAIIPVRNRLSCSSAISS